MYIWTGLIISATDPLLVSRTKFLFWHCNLAGFPKDVYYMYQSEWTDKEVLHDFPHWNWQLGEIVMSGLLQQGR
jgi:beta-galactosidase